MRLRTHVVMVRARLASGRWRGAPCSRCERRCACCLVAAEAIRLAVLRGVDLRSAELARLEAAAAEKARLEAEERRTYVRVFVKVIVGEGDDARETMAGPIRVKRSFTVGQVEEAIQAWLRDNPPGDSFEVPTAGLNLKYGGNSLERERSLLDQALPDDAQLEIGASDEADDA